MSLYIEKTNENYFQRNMKMITELMNFHRNLTKASKEFYQTDEESKETLHYWLKQGDIYNIFYEDKLVGFFYIRFGGQKACWLEDLFIKEDYRSKGLGKQAFHVLDEMMIEKGILAMFVNVIARNTQAIEFYRSCGFDHLNMIELRKNYDKKLDKDEDVDILGFNFKKY